MTQTFIEGMPPINLEERLKQPWGIKKWGKHDKAFREQPKRKGTYVVTNSELADNELFRIACDLAGVQPTRRQASKWRNRKGKAYYFRNEAVRALQEKNNAIA